MVYRPPIETKNMVKYPKPYWHQNNNNKKWGEILIMDTRIVYNKKDDTNPSQF